MNFLTKKHLSRRLLLRGAGTALTAAETTDYRFSTVILGIVASLPFQYKSASTNTLTTAGP